MPVKWTSDLDQLLLLKIIETHDIKVDGDKVVSRWRELTSPVLYVLLSPADTSTATDKGEVPTARAIKERLFKIRQSAKEAGTSPSKGTANHQRSPSKAPTPGRKPKVKAETTAATSTITPTKRKQDSPHQAMPRIKTERNDDEDDHDDDEVEVLEVSARTLSPKPSTSFASSLNPATNQTNDIDEIHPSMFYMTSPSVPMRSREKSVGDYTGQSNSASYYGTFGLDGASDFCVSFEDEVAV